MQQNTRGSTLTGKKQNGEPVGFPVAIALLIQNRNL
jgi:hypothetical protein